MSEKKVFGKKISKVDKELLKDTLLKYARQGYPITSALAELKLSKNYLYRLAEKDEEFADFLDIVKAEQEKFYVGLGLALTTGRITEKEGGSITPSIYIWLTKQILGWKENIDLNANNKFFIEKEIVYKTEWGSQIEATDYSLLTELKKDDK